ncbi:MAG: 3'(2'),5'-bisphosphate nucleotidase CysQ [Thermodesulfobacteriota bacterium]
MEFQSHLKTAIRAAIDAGNAALEVYENDIEVEEKADHSPLTLADQRAHDIIMDYLQPFDIPVLSEEGAAVDYAQRKLWQRLWIVDPLDGTKEFIKKNGEFTINIALVDRQRPVIGVIFVPVLDRLYFAAETLGAYRMDRKDLFPDGPEDFEAMIRAAQPLPLGPPDTSRPYTIVGSRSHATPELEAFVAEKRQQHDTVEFISAGSSLKLCQVAEGFADIYPRLGPTMEWDTAAGQAVAEQAGTAVYLYESGRPLTYNKEDLKNPWFIVEKRQPST